MASANSSPKNNENIIFKCDKHAAFISEKLLTFYQENELFDTVLVVGTNRVSIQAHRIVLCALSDYFLQMFRARQSVSNEVEFKEIDASTLKLVVDFMYSGSITLSLETVEGILKTATFLKIQTLVDGCCDVIEKNINSSNSLKSFRLASELNLPKLKAKALEFTYTHFEELSKRKELLMFSENELIDLLFNGNPHGDIEEYVFLSMVAWINYDKINREHLAFHLLSMVRFQALTPKFIVENRKSVCKTVESYELICSWLQWHLSPETRSKDQQNFHFKPRKPREIPEEQIPEKLAVINIQNGRKINIQVFKTKTNTWDISLETKLPAKKYDCSIIVDDGKLIVAGGNDFMTWTRRVLCLDIQTLKWIDLGETRQLRRRCQLVGFKGHLCAFSGEIGNEQPSLELYNFSTCKWNPLQPPQSPNKNSKIAACNGVLHILSFEDGILQSYDVSSSTWTLRVVKRQALINFGFCAVEGFLYVIGGSYRQQMFSEVKRFDLSHCSWRDLRPLPNVGHIIETTAFKNKIIICNNMNVLQYNIDSDTWISLPTFENFGECVKIHNFYLGFIQTE